MICGSLSCILQPKGEDANIKRDDLARALMVCNSFVEISLFTGYALNLLSKFGLSMVTNAVMHFLLPVGKNFTQIFKVIS